MARKTWIWIAATVAVVVVAIVGWLKISRPYADTTPLKHMPSDAVVVLRVKSMGELRNALALLPYDADLRKAVQLSELDSSLLDVEELSDIAGMMMPEVKDREVFASLMTVGGQAHWVYSLRITNYLEGRKIMSALKDNVHILAQDTIVSGKEMLSVAPTEGRHYFVARKGGCLFVSPSDACIAKVMASKPKNVLYYDLAFSTLMRTAAQQSLVSAFINCGALDSVSVAGHDASMLARFGQWAELDLEFDTQSMSANGFMLADDTRLVGALASLKPQKQTIDNRIPTSASTFVVIASGDRGLNNPDFVHYLDGIGHGSAYRKAQEEANARYKIDVEDKLAQVFAGQIALFSNTDTLSDVQNTCLVVNAENATICQATLNAVIGVYRGEETAQQRAMLSPVPNVNVPVYEAFAPDDELFFVGEMLPSLPMAYYLRYENTLLFANSVDMLRRTLYEILLSRTYGNDANYRNFRLGFSEENVSFYFSTTAAIKSQLLLSEPTGEMSADRQRALGNFYALGVQLSNLGNKPYVTVGTLYEPTRIETPPTAWQNKLDAPVKGRPYAVINHNTQETEYLVQDEENKLYLINPKGLVLWSRPIGEPILGQLTQIDYYNNHKMQYLFATRNNIHLIDRNGNNTADFPIRLQQLAVGGVTYIDYGNPREFRLFVPCEDKMMRLYDRECKNIQGWEMKQTEGQVVTDVEHWVTGNKDYLLFADDYRWYVVNRRGNERFEPKDVATNRGSGAYLVRANTPSAAFVTSTIDGKMASINAVSGAVEYKDIAQADSLSHCFVALEDGKTFAFVTAKSITVVDDHGSVVSSAQLYLSSLAWAELSVNGNIAVWDKEENLGYLIQPDGKIVDGFPVPAASPMSIVYVDGVMNVVVAGRDGTLCDFIK